jgi:hypothetical protein
MNISAHHVGVMSRALRLSVAVLGGLQVAMTSPVSAQQMDTSGTGRFDERSKPMSGPVNDRSVFWVGHSLVEQRTASEWGEIDLMSMVGLLAKDRALGYRSTGHALWGSPVSALWRGKPHGYDRDASSMVPRREAFERTAANYDTLVLTEALPVAKAIRHEYSAYYVRLFYCTLKRANPRARVYLYQTWVNLQAGDTSAGYPSVEQFDWFAEMARERAAWALLADTASKPGVRQPSALDRIGWVSSTDAGCTTSDPILIVPVGDVLVRIAQRMARPQPTDDFRLASAAMLSLTDMVANPIVNWPTDWPRTQPLAPDELRSIRAGFRRRDSAKPHDDIHMSELGIYVAALTHFATLYGQSPLGLRHPDWIGEGVARTLQCIVWEVVSHDPRTGIGATPPC